MKPKDTTAAGSFFRESRVRIAVQTALVCWFLVQCGISVGKLSARNVGTAESTNSEGTVMYPSATMCPVTSLYPAEGQAQEKNLTAAYNSFRPTEELLVRLIHSGFADGSKLIVTSTAGDKHDELKARGVLEDMPVVKFHELTKCITYNPPKLSSMSGDESAISFGLNSTGLVMWIIFVHNEGMVYPTFTKPYGSTVITVSPRPSLENGATLRQSFELTRTKLTLVDGPKTPCDDDHQLDETILNCISKYFEASLGCRLPWTRGSTQEKPCDKEEDYNATYKKLLAFRNLGERDLVEETGCAGSCGRFAFQTRELSQTELAVEGWEGLIMVDLLIISGSYDVKEQYVVYDFSSLVADIGGYLGLLLGQSLLTSYDAIAKMIYRKK